MNILLL